MLDDTRIFGAMGVTEPWNDEAMEPSSNSIIMSRGQFCLPDSHSDFPWGIFDFHCYKALWLHGSHGSIAALAKSFGFTSGIV